MNEVILNDEEVVRFRDALLMRIAGVNTKQVRNVLEELLYRLGATVSGGEPPNEFQRMKLECREIGLVLRDDNGDCYNSSGRRIDAKAMKYGCLFG